MDQPEIDVGDGPIGIILAPTRELVAQIYSEVKKFMKPYHMKVCMVVYGILACNDSWCDGMGFLAGRWWRCTVA